MSFEFKVSMVVSVCLAVTIAVFRYMYYKDKGGIKDLEKAKHCIDYLIELESDK